MSSRMGATSTPSWLNPWSAARIQGQLLEARQGSGLALQELDHGRGQDRTQDASRQAEDERLDEELPQETEARGAQGQADGDLVATLEAAGQPKQGHVGAG